MKCIIKINNKYKKVETEHNYCNSVDCKYYTDCLIECGGGTEHFPLIDTKFQKKPIKHGHLTKS